MTDAEFRQWCMQAFARMDREHAEHVTRMTRMDRDAAERHAQHAERLIRMDAQYAKLLEVQLDLARTHDEHESLMEAMRIRQDQDATRHAAEMAELRRILDAIKDILERGNGHA